MKVKNSTVSGSGEEIYKPTCGIWRYKFLSDEVLSRKPKETSEDEIKIDEIGE